MKIRFDLNLWLMGIRTAGALLVGNSILIYTEVIGMSLKNATYTASVIFSMGLFSLAISSLTFKGE